VWCKEQQKGNEKQRASEKGRRGTELPLFIFNQAEREQRKGKLMCGCARV
jgi:hypothetical protein